MLLALSVLLALVALPSVALFLPYLVPLSLVYRCALALSATQLLHALPLVDTLLGKSNVAHTLFTTASFVAIVALTPHELLRLFMVAVAAVGPLTCASSSLMLIHAVTRVSRYWSWRNGQVEMEAEGEQTAKYKVLILGTAIICYVLALRWIFLYLTLLDVLTLGRLVQAASILLLSGALTCRCILTRRAVLSEAAFVCAILAFSLFQFGLSTLSASERSEWTIDSENRVLDSWLPLAIDGAALVLLAWQLIGDADSTTERFKSEYSSPFAISLYRSATILLLTHYLHVHVTAASIPAAPWWTQLVDFLQRHVPIIVQPLLGLAGDDAASSASAAASWIATVSTHACALFPHGTNALARGISALACYVYVLKRDQREEEEGHEE
jgi:hypothetical protein